MKKNNLLPASYWIRVMWLNEQRRQTLCVMCQAGFLWSGLLFPAQPGTVVVEVGGLCGFRWPVAVWEVRSLVAVGLPAYRKCPLPFPHTLTPYKCRHSFLMAHNEIHLQGCLFTALTETPLCINRAPIQILEVIYLQTCPRTGMLKSVFLVMGILGIHPNR